MSELADIEAVAVGHVRDVAREVVRPAFGGVPSGHEWLSHTQVHTVDDARAGAALSERFGAAFPGHGLEVEDLDPVAGDGRHRWFIDPIDGSANHLRGIPYVAVSAGLERDGVPVVGVVHDLIRDITFSAHAGGGARAHGDEGPRAIRVAPTARLIDAMLIAHLARRGPLLWRDGALQHVLWHVRKIRCMGSIALDLALLAGGEADLLIVGRGSPQRRVDIVGGLVVLEEAGGRVCTADGEPVTDTTRTLLAGPPALCAEFVELVAGFDLESWTADMVEPPTSP